MYQQWDVSRVQISLLSRQLYKMGYPETFEGYAVHSTKNWSDFKRISYEPKRFEDFDIDIEITHCGVCASDLHTINAGWGDPALTVVAGHEIVGKVLKVGSKVKSIKEGDRVGVGAQVWACLDCRIVYCSFYTKSDASVKAIMRIIVPSRSILIMRTIPMVTRLGVDMLVMFESTNDLCSRSQIPFPVILSPLCSVPD